MLPNVFNVSENKGSSFEPIPAGWYEMEITKSAIKASKAGANYLALTFTVAEGEYKGRMVFSNLNLWHPNPKAVEMAQRELASICEACGLENIEDSTELHGTPIGVLVEIREAQGNYPPSNGTKRFVPLSEIPDDEFPF